MLPCVYLPACCCPIIKNLSCAEFFISMVLFPLLSEFLSSYFLYHYLNHFSHFIFQYLLSTVTSLTLLPFFLSSLAQYSSAGQCLILKFST